ncbi:CRISPR-associated protein, TM1802 family [Methanococcus aeolicus Nankai-3]|uniref:CRISPR-associated protein, TM1802 family n=1 Tax=Methanococcus aeolicus (strain ATCC BAA-1280 / DSM 17508 / OCM 812 / Nankai-3) TaxID=419665 RepID=A6UVX8_META3|nr:TIGR02556 family CRISPR-associated protein [Methanococcus aeolicus]ABR56650.1 CRISPR-associated protein, TM1802 family [Methanococcus aeolicus Nankai-3]
MLSSVAQIGNYIIKNEGKDLNNPLSILVENPNVKGNYKDILKITFDYNTMNYLGVNIDEFDKSKILKLMYKAGAPNGADFSPTSKITESEKTLKKKIIKAVSETINHKNCKESNLLKKLEKSLKDNEDKILSDIIDKKGKDGTILTITFKDGENEYFVGDIEEFRNYFIYKATMDYYYIKTGKITSRSSGVCSICNKENEVYGLFRKFGFYSVDKIGNVSGFNPNEAWKTFPICLKCALAVEEGKKYLDENLRDRFYGTEFYMIPKVLFEGDLERVLERYKELSSKENKINGKYSKEEKRLFSVLKNNDIYCYTTFMFFNEGNDFKVLQMIEDVLPSRFSILYKAMEKTENIPLFKNYKVNVNLKKLNKNQRDYFVSIFKNSEDLEELRFLLGYIKEFVDNDNEIFLKLINSIFSNEKIDYHYIINQFISKIRREFKNSESISLSTYKSFMIIYFLINTNLLNIDLKPRGDIILEKSSYDYSEIDKFFEDYEEFFNSEDKKAVFLTGVLVNKLLNLQAHKRQSKPFLAKLQGLKLDKSKVENIFKEASQKLMEYGQEDGINYYSPLKKEIALKYINSGSNWNLSNNEISYIFSLGMSLSSVFDNLKNNKNNEGEKNE